jgi:hypothetical protein
MGENSDNLTISSIHKGLLVKKKKMNDAKLYLPIYKKGREKKRKSDNIKKEETKKKKERRSHKTGAPLLYLCCLSPRPMVYTHYSCV